jgi:hypothetical protein
MMKNILLVGDSIRLSYMPLVKEKLSGAAEVFGPAENCRFAVYTLWNINAWLTSFGKPDIVHWNNGIWDVYRHNEDMGIFTSLEYYIYTLRRILTEIRKSGARIIWATSTPINDPHPYLNNSDIDLYNEHATAFMKSEGIEINDLNAIIRKDMPAYLSEDRVHLSDNGKIACADAVIRMIGL